MSKGRRVPWRNLREVEEIHGWIFDDSSNRSSKQKAANRLAAWQAVTPLPPALESALLLLNASLFDSETEDSYPTRSLIAREAYSTALVRMVNGVVDPLQVGLFARSIASVAAQLDLPLWLVELRHAGTHEDLPSLDILRRGTVVALTWIERNFFIPLLAPNFLPSRKQQIPSPDPWLYEYRTLYRRIVRENVPRSHLDSDFVRLEKQLEKWIARLRSFSPDYAMSSLYGSQEITDTFPLSELSNALLDSRCLLSKSITKLAAGATASIPENLAVWPELLCGIQEKHPLFAQTFIFIVLERVSQEVNLEVSQRASMVRWARWAILHLVGEPADIATLISMLLGRETASEGGFEILIQLLRCLPLPAGHADDIVNQLITKPLNAWDDSQLEEMSERMGLMEQMINNNLGDRNQTVQRTNRTRVGGWDQLEAAVDWQPCPLGVVTTY